MFHPWISRFLFIILNSQKDRMIASLMTGTSNVSLNLSDLEYIEIPFPSYEIQLNIVEEYETHSRRIFDLEKEVIERKIIQDSCHAIMSKYHQKDIISFGDICTFSMHPLKNLNVWGDGGFIITNSKKISDKLRLMRNHGLKNRNKSLIFSYNSPNPIGIKNITMNHMLQ